MSGYQGDPGWNDPYAGGPSDSAWDPEGRYGAGYAPGYGPPHGHVYGPPGVPHGDVPGQASLIVALVLSSLATLSCCNILAAPAIVTSAMGLHRRLRDPESARTLTMWSWILFGAAMVLYVVGIVLLIAYDISTSPYYY